MNTAPPDRADIGRLADELYQTHIRAQVRPEDHNKFLAVDVDTGRFEIDANDRAAVSRLRGDRANVRVVVLTAGGQPVERMLGMKERPVPPNPSEIDRLGEELFETTIRERLRPEDRGKFVAVDVDTGEYEIDASDLAACHRIHARRDGARVWLTRAGHKATYKLRRVAP